MDEYLLPLFPLELVLLPEEPLPLHIFEERYKEMIGECLAERTRGSEQQEFGVVFAKGEQIEPVGCSARIINITRKYDDGRLDIFTVGRRRFEILYTDEARSYLRAGVTFFEDDSGADTPSETEAARAIELFRSALQRLRKSEEIPVHFPKPYRYLSFRIAASLPLDLNFKQRLLSLRNEAARLESVLSVTSALITRLDFVEQARKKSGGNGNALGNA